MNPEQIPWEAEVYEFHSPIKGVLTLFERQLNSMAKEKRQGRGCCALGCLSFFLSVPTAFIAPLYLERANWLAPLDQFVGQYFARDTQSLFIVLLGVAAAIASFLYGFWRNPARSHPGRIRWTRSFLGELDRIIPSSTKVGIRLDLRPSTLMEFSRRDEDEWNGAQDWLILNSTLPGRIMLELRMLERSSGRQGQGVGFQEQFSIKITPKPDAEVVLERMQELNADVQLGPGGEYVLKSPASHYAHVTYQEVAFTEPKLLVNAVEVALGSVPGSL